MLAPTLGDAVRVRGSQQEEKGQFLLGARGKTETVMVCRDITLQRLYKRYRYS
ncbi:hypothetical protein [Nostoc sp. ChiVER01]|uniref:hypothetical protein n=1 Tax=Nostoc sp. ChiVER01 TaxID=3075382 RepID=UPI002AD3535E|nr:hypothetical protein [Nostoc sp. ChiVER01]MDZ8224345.1 hypothetical protein [Nostoc sp. ChiVER01]